MKSLLALGLLVFGLPAAWAGDEAGFKPLFDGKTLDGWKLIGAKGPGYVVKDGVIVCPADGGGKLFSEKEYSNFTMRFEFRMQEDGNNGVGIRAPLQGHTATLGMEIQILDHTGPKYSKARLKPEQMHGSVYSVIPARTGFLRKAWEWNEQEIRANGRQITVTLNGVIILDVNLDIVKEPEILKKYPGLLRTSGHLGFLGHNTHVEFRNIRIKEL